MPVTIVTRAGKGSPLTYNEVDANFNNLNNGKDDTINNLGLIASMDKTADFIAVYDASATAVKKIAPLNTVFFNRTLVIKALPDGIPTYVGNGVARITVPQTLDGLYLSNVAGEIGAHVYTAGVTGVTFTTGSAGFFCRPFPTPLPISCARVCASCRTSLSASASRARAASISAKPAFSFCLCR